MLIEENKNLRELTTFEIGGPARFFVVINSISDALEALKFSKHKSLPVFILGGGSNILVSDSGFEGLVIKNQILDIRNQKSEIGAGEEWDDVVKKAVESGLGGIECLSAIPGTAGGAVVQNIGAYGQTLADVVSWVEAIIIGQNQITRFSKDECGFEYRNSIFKKNPGKYLVTKFALSLAPARDGQMKYPDVRKYFEGKSQTPTLEEVRNAVISIRASRGYVIMEGFEAYKSAGSYFKNPIMETLIFELVKDKVHGCRDPWFWEIRDKVKVSAACLLQSAGFDKGHTWGNVGISPKHPLALINRGGGTAQEMKKFADAIKRQVKDKTGVDLEEEIIYVGKFIS